MAARSSTAYPTLTWQRRATCSAPSLLRRLSHLGDLAANAEETGRFARAASGGASLPDLWPQQQGTSTWQKQRS